MSTKSTPDVSGTDPGLSEPVDINTPPDAPDPAPKSHGSHDGHPCCSTCKELPCACGHRGDERPQSSAKALVLLSNKIKNHGAVASSVLPNVQLVQYKYENSSVETILHQVRAALDGAKLLTIACVLHTKPGNILLFSDGDDKETLTPSNIGEHNAVVVFFKTLVKMFFTADNELARFDLLACSALRSSDISHLAPILEKLMEVPVGISKEILGTDIQLTHHRDGTPLSCVGEMYFRVDKLRNWSPRPQTLAGFERIRTVGKGAYGAAVLYRKKDDDSLVILKEIDMLNLAASERQMALNEIRVLSIFDHPNIISYYDSFEEDGTLMIEMEYADGGTLQQYLTSLQGKRELEEREILIMFQQMVLGIKHIHDHSILHRDMKTANVFLTKDGIVKIGDFGISKIMSPNTRGASTVLGTPYYISPEICEGKPYNEKSDVWALGCILYEMACLQKTFEGSNLPALVNKIMKGQFTPVRGNYSMEFKTLVQDLLQREPEYRPSATELVLARLPLMMAKYEDSEIDEDNQGFGSSAAKGQRARSVLYHFNTNNFDMIPLDLPAKINIKEVAVSVTHNVVVTFEGDVYTWGEGKKGQLGHGDLLTRTCPEVVQSLRSKSIIRACCGDGYSVFGSDNGIVMTCGDGSKGCLGHGDWSSASRPRLIELLLRVDVTSISCGPHHVAVVGTDGEVFAWGLGKDGRLGLGDEEDHCEPKEVSFGQEFVQDVRCGIDGTMFLTDMGCLLACGSNEDNKLGLNNRKGFLMVMKNIFAKTEVEGRRVPTKIKLLASFRVIDMILGAQHSAVLVEPGVLYTFGRNTSGQLGLGNTKPHEAPMLVREMKGKVITTVACGNNYTVVGTMSNALYMWGRGSSQETRPNEEPAAKEANCSQENSGSGCSLPAEVCSSREEVASSGKTGSNQHPNSAPPSCRQNDKGGRRQDRGSTATGDASAIDEKLLHQHDSSHTDNPQARNRLASGSSAISADSRGKPDNVPLLLRPRPIFMIGDVECTEGNESYQVTLSKVLYQHDHMLVHVETTCPPPPPRRKSRRRKRTVTRKLSDQGLQVPETTAPQSANSGDGGDEYTSSEASEMDTLGSIPTWIKKELKESQTRSEEADESDDENADVKGRVIRDGKDINMLKGAKTNAQDSGREVGVQADGRRIQTDGEAVRTIKELPTMIPSDTGIQVTSYQLSSDSSCNDIKPNIQGIEAEQNVNDFNFGTALHAVTKPVVAAQQKPTVGSSRPLSRLRPGRGRARTSSWTIEGSLRNSKKSSFKHHEDSLKMELQKVQEEKQLTLDQLQQLEDVLEQQQKYQLEEEASKAIEEKVMKKEIDKLREELHVQSRKMAENNDLVLKLQEQLVKIQSDQLRQNARDRRAASGVNRNGSTSGQSKVCTVS